MAISGQKREMSLFPLRNQHPQRGTTKSHPLTLGAEIFPKLTKDHRNIPGRSQS
jgi:hypothetical protein